MFISTNSMSDMKLGHIGSKARSPDKILENPCVHFREHNSIAIFMKLSEYLSQLNLGQDRNWVMSDQKLGHKIKL